MENDIKYKQDEKSELIRINKYLSEIGFCSRREADRLIEDGKVIVDGKIATTGMKVGKDQEIRVNNKKLKPETEEILIAVNKPVGIVCTTSKKEKNNIIDFLNFGKRIYPIGRLDKDSEGLLLMTNQGELVNKIMRAGNYHEKEYLVKVSKPITKEFIKQMASGVPILDTVTRECEVEATGKDTFRIILTQGLNRQIRRMCEYLGYRVVELKRIRIMNIKLGKLKSGGYRNVTVNELRTLYGLIEDSSSTTIIPDNKKTRDRSEE